MKRLFFNHSSEVELGKEVGRKKPLRPLSLCLLAIVVGVVTALGAVAFRALIAVFHNAFFLGKWSWSYDANLHTPAGPWGFWVILVPVAGAVGVVFLVKNFAPEAKGHGVPEVMDAIYYKKGIIRPLVAVVKSLASALSIGSGGSVGREGPIIQIGSSLGSTVGQIFRMPAWQRITLIAAGAGSGIAATFNTPIGGVLFAAEIMLHEVSVWTLVPVVISTATATYIGRLFFGPTPSFIIPAFQTPSYHPTNAVVLLTYVGLGLLSGLVSAAFIKSIYATEDLFERNVSNYYARHMAGMLLVGAMMYWLLRQFGHYYIQGVGYATIQELLSGTMTSLWLMVLLLVLKLVATSLTLGSGASGGIFSPALFLGGTLGGAYGTLLGAVFPALPISPPAFAVAGMAGVVGGATGAALTAIVMIFEMTLDYRVIVPMTITVAISYGIRKRLSRESIYTMKLVRRGHYMPEAMQANMHYMKRAKDLMETRFERVSASTPLQEFIRNLSESTAVNRYLVADDGRLIGVVSREAAIRALGQNKTEISVGEIANRRFDFISDSATLFEIVARMRSGEITVLLVTRQGASRTINEVQGVVSKERVADSLIQAVELFSD